ncbi:helix-turn-helix transcriptional regulator [Pseudonocardia dioxanivorans]|uniref:helix-turn-helix transcriptional regulator n=1 Tax=Pseudonocardia dioxanivorans TaxID=240495 RepID=UPI000CD206C3|nr:LuxR C-terminal-related transcriptional regulator [Pseudonocardia dioxanivorans]
MPPVRREITEALAALDRGMPSALLVELDERTRASGAFAQLTAAARAAAHAVVVVPARESDELSATSALLEVLAGSGTGDADGGAIVDRVAELLDARSHDAPVVVVIENARWTDPATLLALRTLPERLRHLPVLWAVGVEPGPSRVDRVVAALRRIGAVTVPPEPPGWDAVAGGPAALLKVGSVIGIEFDPDVAARVLGTSVGSLLPEIDAALAGGVLVDNGPTLRFADARFRDDLYGSLPSSVRRALHHEVARHTMAWPGGEAAAVRHLARSTGRLSDEDLGMVRGAVGRLATVSPEDAAELAFQVSELFAGSDPHRVEFLITGATHLGRTSRVGEALSILEHLQVSGLATTEEARLRLVAAHLHQAAGDDHEAMDHVTHALALPTLDAHVELALLKVRAAGHVNLGETDAAIRVSRPLLSAARSSADPATRVSADLFASQLAFSQAKVTAAIELAEQAASGVEVSATRPLHAPRIPELWLATVLLSSDRADEAADLLLEGQRHYERRGLGWSAPYWHTVRAIERWMCDELDDAAAEAETALEVADRLDIVRTRRLTRAVLAVIEVDRGRVDDARRALDGATLPRRPNAFDIWTAAAHLRLAPDSADDAHRWLDRHCNRARLMSLRPRLWPSLVVPGRPARRLRDVLGEIGRAAHDQRVVVAAVGTATSADRRSASTRALATGERATSGWAALTASERRVARLVAEGHTNRAIAERLHVSVHTVGTHLRHAFTKLDINTRVELTRVALLQGDGADDA